MSESKKIHLCAFNATTGLGGVEQAIQNYLLNLPPECYRCTYIAPRFEGDLSFINRLNNSGVDVRDVAGMQPPPGSGPTAAPAALRGSTIKLWKRLIPQSVDEALHHFRNTRKLMGLFHAALSQLDHPPDICHLFAGKYAWMAACAKACKTRFPETKIVLRLGNPPVFLRPTRLERSLFKQADAVMFVSRHTQAAWEKALHTKLNNAHVLPTPVNLEFCSGRDPKAAGEPLVLATIGRLSPIKGNDTAIRALHALMSADIPAELWIMGIGPEEVRLRQLARELGVADNTVFMGFVDTPENYLKNIDILLQLSTTEGMPNSVLQAMGHGVPVISTPVGGIPELITDHKTGLLVPHGDAPAVTEAILTIMRDHSLRCLLIKYARDFVHSRHTAAAATANLAELYEQLLAPRI